MLETYDFVITQVRYVKAATDQILLYRPDGLSPSDIAALTPNPDPIRVNYIAKLTAAGAARDARNNGATAVHNVGVDFLAQARSIYRRNVAAVEQLDRILVKDQTFTQAMTRGDQSGAVWAGLPNVGTPPAAFTVRQNGATVTKANLDTLLTTARAADVALPGLDQAFQKAEADLHVKQHDLEDFVTAALVQGRSQFSEGTAEREIIDAIPTMPATQPPAKAVITEATFIAPAEAKIVYEADHATSYNVWVKISPATDFTLVAEDRIEKTFSVLDTHGDFDFKVAGVNSRGPGPESDVASVSG